MATNIYGSPIMAANEESDKDNGGGSNSETEVGFFSFLSLVVSFSRQSPLKLFRPYIKFKL